MQKDGANAYACVSYACPLSAGSAILREHPGMFAVRKRFWLVPRLGRRRFFTFAITTHPTLLPVVPTCSCDHTRHIDMPCNPEEAWVTFIHTWYTFVHTAATDACDTVTKNLWRLYLENDEEPMRAEHIVALLASRGVPRYTWISITLSRSRDKVATKHLSR